MMKHCYFTIIKLLLEQAYFWGESINLFIWSSNTTQVFASHTFTVHAGRRSSAVDADFGRCHYGSQTGVLTVLITRRVEWRYNQCGSCFTCDSVFPTPTKHLTQQETRTCFTKWLKSHLYRNPHQPAGSVTITCVLHHSAAHTIWDRKALRVILVARTKR